MKSAITFEPNVTESLLEIGLPGVAINPASATSDHCIHGALWLLRFSNDRRRAFPMMEKPEDFNELLLKAIDKIGGLTTMNSNC